MTMLRSYRPWVALLLALAIATPAAAELPDFTQLVERSAPAVVNITARKGATPAADDPSAMDPEDMPELFRRFFGPGGPHRGLMPERVSGGSGFIVSADGYILTNHHVVEGADEVIVRLKDRREFEARVVGSDPQSDIALLKTEAKSLPVVALGSSGTLKPGEWVVAIGSPFGLQHSVSAGIVSAVGRALANDQRYVPFIQTDVAINRGNSGGPLFNVRGEVVGINSQIFSNTGGSIGLSFSIPVDVAKSVMQQLRTKGKVTRGVLGVEIRAVDRDYADALGLDSIGGAFVNTVNGGSAAEKAGLKPGDVILQFNEIPIGDSAELPPLVGATAPGTRVTLTVFRDGKTLTLPVVVAELDADAVAAAPADAGSKGSASNALGLAVREPNAQERAELGIDGEGVLVERVTGSAARRAGVQAGDVVLSVGRKPVRSASDFERASKDVAPGQAVLLRIRRDDGVYFVAVRPSAADHG
jgi:serine protease Do